VGAEANAAAPEAGAIVIELADGRFNEMPVKLLNTTPLTRTGPEVEPGIGMKLIEELSAARLITNAEVPPIATAAVGRNLKPAPVPMITVSCAPGTPAGVVVENVPGKFVTLGEVSR
jgi:hypothetical protein